MWTKGTVAATAWEAGPIPAGDLAGAPGDSPEQGTRVNTGGAMTPARTSQAATW